MRGINSLVIALVRRILLISLSLFYIVSVQVKTEAQVAYEQIYDGNLYITNVSWSRDGRFLTFQEDSTNLGIQDNQYNSWHEYDVETGSLSFSSLWPRPFILPQSLPSLNPLPELARYDGTLSFTILSPNQRYMVYASQCPIEQRCGGYPLSLIDLQNFEGMILDDIIVHNFNDWKWDFIIDWSSNDNAFTYMNYNQARIYYVNNFSESLQRVDVTRLNLLLDGRDEVVAVIDEANVSPRYVFDISANGQKVLLEGFMQPDNHVFYFWDIEQPTEGYKIADVTNDIPIAGAFTLDQRNILYINHAGLTQYDLETGESTILNSEINSTWAERAWFSPDMRYVALLVESRGEMYIAEVPSS